MLYKFVNNTVRAHGHKNSRFPLIFAGGTGLENSTLPLVFTSTSGCRASENFDITSENIKKSHVANIFCDAGQVLILRYFEAWGRVS